MLKAARLLSEAEAASMPERPGAATAARHRKYSDRLLIEAERLAISLGGKKPALKKACDRLGIPVDRLRRHRGRVRVQSGKPRCSKGPKSTYTPAQEKNCCLLALRYHETKGWSLGRSFHYAGRRLGMKGELINYKWRRGDLKL